MAETAVVVARKVDSKIFVLRGQRVILDTDLAELYGVQVRHLNQQAKRNAKRFPLQVRKGWGCLKYCKSIRWARFLVVRMRRAIVGNRQILTKLAELEHRLKSHDADIQGLMNAIRELMSPEEPNRRRIGFEAPSEPRGKAVKGRAMPLRRNQ